MAKINFVELLERVKYEFKILYSDSLCVEFSDGTKIVNETITFGIPVGYRKKKELCSLVELIYILKALSYNHWVIWLYSKVIVRKEGEQYVCFSENFINSMINDCMSSLTRKGIVEWIKEIKKENDFINHELVLTNRVDWNNKLDSCRFRRRLAIGSISCNARHLKLVNV